MGLIHKIIRYFDGHIETSDHHEDARLRTHYYKTTKDKAISILEEIIRKNAFLSLIELSKERGEIAVTNSKGKKGLLVLTVITVSPFKTSVDMSFTVDRGTLGSHGHRLVEQIYSELDSKLSSAT